MVILGYFRYNLSSIFLFFFVSTHIVIKYLFLGQGVHQGDSGAGFTFEHSSLHFLTGIVSVKDAATNDSIAVFTDVSRHISWIHEIYTNYTYASDIVR